MLFIHAGGTILFYTFDVNVLLSKEIESYIQCLVKELAQTEDLHLSSQQDEQDLMMLNWNVR